jgi:6-phosphogluconolactonase
MLTSKLPTTRAEDSVVFISAFAAGDAGGIHAFALDTDSGKLKPLHRTAEVEYPFFLALSPDRRCLYAIHAPGQFGGAAEEQVAAFRVPDRSGKLELLNRQSSRGSASCYLDVDATGRNVVVANYLTGSVALLPVAEDGKLGPAASFHQHSGASIDPSRQTGPHAHCSVVTPDNRYVLVADLGIDQILVYGLEAAKHKLLPQRPAFVRTAPGAGPRHLTFHPNQRFVYVVNELGNSVTLFDYEPQVGTLIERQTLSTLPDDFSGETKCADVKVTPNGRFLYATNRGHDSIAGYRIADDGQLTRMGIVPSLGAGPQNLAITSDGRWLLCANMPANQVVVFRIHAESGELAATGETVSIPGPSCMLMY